ncbi:hypothetical protein FGO68_gene3167 [Halteria grandinella]|uniref:Uncharacterized protein n=1 Tax=Halteria grandinella TaxID=5974 RepID=A0A8J8T4L2_HALGN|nr:hypothetical protein FGO68_gene3167 [Halteria grandinella]
MKPSYFYLESRQHKLSGYQPLKNQLVVQVKRNLIKKNIKQFQNYVRTLKKQSFINRYRHGMKQNTQLKTLKKALSCAQREKISESIWIWVTYVMNTMKNFIRTKNPLTSIQNTFTQRSRSIGEKTTMQNISPYL